MEWLLELQTRLKLEQFLANGLSPTADQQNNYEARTGEGRVAGEDILAVSDDGIATIEVHGVLTKNFDFFAWLFGGGSTTYGDIIAALAIADADTNVNSIVLDIDSPGGTLAGLFDALGALESTVKPVKAFVSGMAASAAYAIASQASSIEVSNEASCVGSVGVVVSQYIEEDVVTLTSTNAPLKAPDASTEDGKAAIVSHLDELHTLFVDKIASGRGVTAEKVNESYGRGAVVLANAALNCGMIDCIRGESSKITNLSVKTRSEDANMDLNELKLKHAELYSAIVEEGVTKERDRVSAHLILGEASGAMELAVKAVKEGSELTATLNAEYSAAGMKNREVQAHVEDDDKDGGAGDEADTAVEDEENALEKGMLAIMGGTK